MFRNVSNGLGTSKKILGDGGGYTRGSPGGKKIIKR